MGFKYCIGEGVKLRSSVGDPVHIVPRLRVQEAVAILPCPTNIFAYNTTVVVKGLG